jgi:hypothetical protein
MPFGCGPRGEAQETLGRGGKIIPSIIRKIQEVHGREETPHNGGVVFPKDV